MSFGRLLIPFQRRWLEAAFINTCPPFLAILDSFFTEVRNAFLLGVTTVFESRPEF